MAEDTLKNKEKIKEEEEDTDSSLIRYYEIGFLLAPNIAEERLGEELTAIKSVVEKYNGVFVSEEFPKLMSLAYEIRKNIQGKYEKYNQAYFGWVKYELEAPKVEEIKKELETNSNLIRFLIVKTIKGNTRYQPKSFVKKTDEKLVKKTVDEKDKGPVSEEEIDKSIADLVID